MASFSKNIFQNGMGCVVKPQPPVIQRKFSTSVIVASIHITGYSLAEFALTLQLLQFTG